MAINYKTDGTEHYKPRQWRLIDGAVVEESDVVVYTFSVSDVDDPDLLAGFQMMDWQKSEAGRWVADNCIGEPYWVRSIQSNFYGHCYQIVARLTSQNETFFKLKFK